MFFVWYKSFYWMRLFTSTAFFINLLKETFYGIKAFVIMMTILVLCVANLLYILNLRNDNEKDQAPIFSQDLPYNFINSIIWSYMHGLGEFDTDHFAGTH